MTNREEFLDYMSQEGLRLLKLTKNQRDSLFQEMYSFDLTVDDTRDEDVVALAKRVKVSELDIRATLNLVHFLTAQKDKDFDNEDYNMIRLKIEQNAKETVTAQQVDGLFASLSSIVDSISQNILQFNAIAKTMPTFKRCNIACELRYLPESERVKESLRPVAIVRLDLDEGDPLIFQCLPTSISKLKRALDQALQHLERLEQGSARIFS